MIGSYNTLVSHKFTRGKTDQIVFIKREDGELIVAQVYVDDIIFGSTKDELAHSFSKLMQAEFEMSMIGELSHFFGLQIRQQESSIFLSQSKYARNLVKKFVVPLLTLVCGTARTQIMS